MLNEKELELLDRITLLAIANGNTVTPAAYDPTPEEYRMLHAIRNKLNMSNKKER